MVVNILLAKDNIIYSLLILFTKNIKMGENGGEKGIRTLEGLHLTRVPGVLLQPLGHLSKKNPYFSTFCLKNLKS